MAQHPRHRRDAVSAVVTFLRATRAPSLVAGAMPAILLTALVAYQGSEVNAPAFWMTMFGLIALQAGVNVINDLFDDASGLDADPEFEENPFPLGSRAIQEGFLSRRGMWLLAGACFGTGLACGLWLNLLHPGHVVLVIGVVGFLLGYFYTAPPFQFAYYGVGEPIIFLLFGPLAGLGTYYVQTGRLEGEPAWLLSCMVGVLAMAILYMHHFPQHLADKRHGKKTPIVRLGPVGAGRLVPVMLAIPYLLVLAGIGAGWLPWLSLALFVSFPFAWKASQIALTRADEPKAMTAAFGQVMLLHLSGGSALSLALWLA